MPRPIAPLASAPRPRRALELTLMGLGLLLSLASGWRRDDDPCDDDPLGCEEGGQLTVDPDCKLTGDLRVHLGQGAEALDLFASGDQAAIYWGPQGGNHLALGVQLDNPAVDYPGVEISFSARVASCELDDPDCDWEQLGYRTVTLTKRKHLKLEGGVLKATGYLVVLDHHPAWQESGDDWTRLIITAAVRDRCGRSGEASFDQILETASPGTNTGTDTDTDTGP